MFSRKVILRALVCALLAMIPFPEPENQLYDLKLRILARTQTHQPQSPLVVEVSKDDFEVLRKRFHDPRPFAEAPGAWREKFESIRKEFFWDDAVYSHVLEALLKGSPKRILVTFFYNDSLVLLEGNPSLQRLARNKAVLWGSQFDSDQKLLRPAPELTGTENYGFTNVHFDQDGVVRRAYLLYRNHISLPFRALVDGPGRLPWSLPLSEPFLIRFAGFPGQIPTCRVLDLFDEAKSLERCGKLEGRYIILSSAGSLGAGGNLDRTPVGYMSRGELLANILLTARDASQNRPVSPVLQFFVVLAHALILGWVVLSRKGSRQLLAAGGLMLAEALFSLGALGFFHWQIPLIPFFLVTVMSYFAFLWMKFGHQETKRWQAEKNAHNLKELDELKSNFLSLMSHDLKTPIAKVQALTERLNREARHLTEDQRSILSSIQKSNEELSHYILSILNFQRIESQEIKLQKKSHDINLLIEEVAERLSPLAHDRGVDIRLDLEPMFAFELDEKLIRQVLNNILDNAIKYNSAGTRVVVRSIEQEDFVEVSVEDNGAGIPPEQQKQLFQKFSRTEKGTAERVKGTGLGLYLAKYFIELHGGSIGMESVPGRTRFHFRLPIS
jgi:two-component system phosphate regulon sensor histidine kinase PhoR